MKRLIIAVLAMGFVLASCSEKEKEDEGAAQPCLQTPAPIADPGFPTGFPSIGDVTWTASQDAGPSKVVTGYTGDALTDLFNEMKEKFGEGGYSVAKSEKDPHDAEVNFTSSGNDGQVRLAEECQGRTSVVITVRPKS